MTTEEIENLLESASYSADSIPKLEAYVQSQISGAVPYSFDANRSLAKLYQIYPESTNMEGVLARILMLTMVEFPCTDMLGLLCVISEKDREAEVLAAIIKCYELLDSCKFQEFWGEYEKLEANSDLKSFVASSANKLRQGIVQVLALSYRAAPLAVVHAALHTDSIDASMSPIIQAVTSDQVEFCPTPDNTKRHRVFQEGVKLTSISNIVVKSQ